ncbi:unnamed protein product [Sphenostylis stenocarpa]|uniref:Uncharacterized protein n=1 Tax=Sphenostylis stenocarpa TaxID=92480 RepID=A0AA86S9M4_9FABA|nr:unnamed protein product [Sphenostylis stenocarpa]
MSHTMKPITQHNPHTATPPPSTPLLHITVTSLQGINHYTSFLNPTIKPFITLSSTHLLSTSPLLHHNFTLRIALDPSFFSDTRASLHLQLFTKRRILGLAHLGSCLIPAHDIGLLPHGSVRYLSYRLRGKDGAKGHVVINLSVRLENAPWISTDTCHTVIGIPVTAIRGTCTDYCTTIMSDRRKVR